MAKKRSKLRQKLVTARSELRKGFAIPTKEKILARARQISRVRLITIFWFMFGRLSKTNKIKVLVKLDSSPKSQKKRKTKRKSTKRRSTRSKNTKARRKTAKRRTKRKTTRKSKKPRTAKQKRADKRNGARLKKLNKKKRR